MLNDIGQTLTVLLVIGDVLLAAIVVVLLLILDAVEGGFDVNLEHPKVKRLLRYFGRGGGFIIAFLLMATAIVAYGDEPLLGAGNEDDDETSTTTNTVSNIETSLGWRRYHVIGEAGGTVKDKSGTIADYLTGQTMASTASYAGEIAEAAHEGMTNALDRLYAVTNNMSRFQGKIYIAGDLMADQTERANIWCYIASEAYADGKDIYHVWFSRDLPSQPRMVFRYRTAIGTEEVSGIWENWNHPVSTNGFDGCRKIVVERPSFVGRVTMRTDSYPKLGTASQGGFDFAKKVFYLTTDENTVTNLPWTGIWTNSANKVFQWNNGIFCGEVEDTDDED